MEDENKKQRSRWERWKDPYRLVILNDETFQEVRSLKLSLLNVYVMLSTLVVIVATLVIMAIAFTPVRRLIPGYGQDYSSEIRQLSQMVDSLQQMADAQKIYNEARLRRFASEVEYEPESPPENLSGNTQNPPPVERSEAEEQLRNEVEMENLRGQTGQGSTGPVNVSPRDVPLEQMYFTTPVSGSISAGFDADKGHIGVDIIAPKNTPIKAAMDGWVITSDWTLDTGNTIAVQHTNNIVTFYKHNSVLLKKTGEFVKAGEAIAIIGNTGELTDGPHLHFELWHRGAPVNPIDFVNFR